MAPDHPATIPAVIFIGIDLSARRGLDVAMLDHERRVVGLWHAPDLNALSAALATYAEPLVVAVDAPQARSDFPLRRPEVRATLPVPPPEGRFARYRVCDYELARRGTGLYLLPEPGLPAPEWMAVGFATFQRLQERHGLRLPRHNADHAATLLEIYPYAGFVTLLRGRPPRKTTREGAEMRLAALHDAGLRDLPAQRLTHDTIDALCAAYTAWTWHNGQGCALGLPEEGLIVLPVPMHELMERYR